MRLRIILRVYQKDNHLEPEPLLQHQQAIERESTDAMVNLSTRTTQQCLVSPTHPHHPPFRNITFATIFLFIETFAYSQEWQRKRTNEGNKSYYDDAFAKEEANASGTSSNSTDEELADDLEPLVTPTDRSMFNRLLASSSDLRKAIDGIPAEPILSFVALGLLMYVAMYVVLHACSFLFYGCCSEHAPPTLFSQHLPALFYYL